MADFYDDRYKDLDIEHLLFLREVLYQVKLELTSIPEEYLNEEDVRAYLEDRFGWLEKIQIELEELLLFVLH